MSSYLFNTCKHPDNDHLYSFRDDVGFPTLEAACSAATRQEDSIMTCPEAVDGVPCPVMNSNNDLPINSVLPQGCTFLPDRNFTTCLPAMGTHHISNQQTCLQDCVQNVPNCQADAERICNNPQAFCSEYCDKECRGKRSEAYCRSVCQQQCLDASTCLGFLNGRCLTRSCPLPLCSSSCDPQVMDKDMRINFNNYVSLLQQENPFCQTSMMANANAQCLDYDRQQSLWTYNNPYPLCSPSTSFSRLSATTTPPSSSTSSPPTLTTTNNGQRVVGMPIAKTMDTFPPHSNALLSSDSGEGVLKNVNSLTSGKYYWIILGIIIGLIVLFLVVLILIIRRRYLTSSETNNTTAVTTNSTTTPPPTTSSPFLPVQSVPPPPPPVMAMAPTSTSTMTTTTTTTNNVQTRRPNPNLIYQDQRFRLPQTMSLVAPRSSPPQRQRQRQYLTSRLSPPINPTGFRFDGTT